MNVNDWIHVIAGIFILASIALGFWVSPYWFLLTAFVGANLLQYGFSKFCPMGFILRKLGVSDHRACD
jgi:hypothetical protein